MLDWVVGVVPCNSELLRSPQIGGRFAALPRWPHPGCLLVSSQEIRKVGHIPHGQGIRLEETRIMLPTGPGRLRPAMWHQSHPRKWLRKSRLLRTGLKVCSTRSLRLSWPCSFTESFCLLSWKDFFSLAAVSVLAFSLNSAVKLNSP